MDQWKLWLVHLLPLCLCFDHEVTHVMTTGREPYVAPLCSTESLRKNALVYCKISRERSLGEHCLLMYQHGRNFVPECDPRFTIMTVNQTVFLHLASLTPVDSGNYTCRCPFPDGTDLLHLKITVKEPSSWILITSTVIGFAFIIVTGVVLGHILRKKRCRYNTRSGATELPVCETPVSLVPDDPYTSLQQPENDLYQTMSPGHRQHDTKKNSASNNIVTDHLDDQEIDGGERWEIYENI